jgi:hypothetical protein
VYYWPPPLPDRCRLRQVGGGYLIKDESQCVQS